MPTFKMQVKIVGPAGETIDAWTDEIPPDALYIQPGRDAKTPGKCYFRPNLMTGVARKITEDMLRFMQTRGWYRVTTDVPTTEPDAPLRPTADSEIRAI